jgi:hypothetical protein
MSETLTNPKPEKKKARNRKPLVKVVFDTNALYVTQNSVGSASDLVRQDIVDLISESTYPDLAILWYLPEVVRHERQFQMQTEALKLRNAINRIERLLNHHLALTDQALLDRVRAQIDEAKIKLGFQELPLDHKLVDWAAIIHAAVYRTPPFETGETEKGFRDALIAESFLQLVASSPRTAAICRVVLVTSDGLLTKAVNARIAGFPNASVLANIEELKGLINTIVSNAGEEFISQLQPKAERLFFMSSDDQNTLYYKEELTERLTNQFASVLETLPKGTSFRRNRNWRISRPNFSRKEGRRVFWTSRIEIEVEAGTISKEEEKPGIGYLAALGAPLTEYSFVSNQKARGSVSLSSDSLLPGMGWNRYGTQFGTSETTVVTHKGSDVFEVLWSTEVTISKELKKAKIEDIRHIGLSCQPIQ